MLKNKFFYVVLFVAIVLFKFYPQMFKSEQTFGGRRFVVAEVDSKYGPYLSGRVAHLRYDFDDAVKYYVEALNADPENLDLVGRLYIILASESKISEAAEYAKKAFEAGDRNSFINIIIAVDDIKKGNTTEAIEELTKLKGVGYDEFITPLLVAWAYAANGEDKSAIDALGKLPNDPGFNLIHDFHVAIINDIFNNDVDAKNSYDRILKSVDADMSLRLLQVLSNYYARIGEKEFAVELIEKYNDSSNSIEALNRMAKRIENSNSDTIGKEINNADDGLAEALFSIAATMRQGVGGIDISQVFVCLALYANPNYDLAKMLLADIMEIRGLYDKANKIYDEVPENSDIYIMAQMKKAANLTMEKKYEDAVVVLKKLYSQNPTHYQLLLDLGDNLRILKKYDEALKYYNEAVETIEEEENKHWVAFYALGVTYDKNKQWDLAEENLLKAYSMSDNHYIVTNYLGYSWLEKGKNIEEAFAMIVDAYNQAPNDGHITDSLGWALYKLGMYDKSVEFLEKASEAKPANALITNHLGDAYWRAGRRLEAGFQWERVLVLTEDIEDVDLSEVTEKIANGLGEVEVPTFDETIIKEKMEEIEE